MGRATGAARRRFVEVAALWPGNRSIRERVINPKGLKQSSLARACEVRPAAPSQRKCRGFTSSAKRGRRRISMTDNLELAIFLAILIVFVVCGCLVTRAPEK